MERRFSKMFSGCEDSGAVGSVGKKILPVNQSVPNFNFKDMFNVNLGPTNSGSSPPKPVKEELESPTDEKIELNIDSTSK